MKGIPMKNQLIAMSLATMFAAPLAYADHHGSTALDNCVKAALDKHDGKIVSLRAEIENGNSQYEVHIKGKDGKIYEAEYDAKTGNVLETEGEVQTGDPACTGKDMITIDAAQKTALAKTP